MTIDFSYRKIKPDLSSGYIFKGKHYRCSYIRYPSVYRNPAKGTETVELYHFVPKGELRASVLILPGLGSANVKFLIWMGTHLASSGINAAVLVLPGNYTRVEDGTVSGSSFLQPPVESMYRFWEHAVVDSLSVLDLLEQRGQWKQNNCLVGYCLGGMVATMVSVLDTRINQSIFMTTGGHFPRILHESKVSRFVREQFSHGHFSEDSLNRRESLYRLYAQELPLVRTLSVGEIMTKKEIHPLFRIDPLSYAHLLDKDQTVFIDALFDRVLPLGSRSILYKEMPGIRRHIFPIGHVSWLPFEFLLARYILHKVHIHDRRAERMLMLKEAVEDPLVDFFGEG